MSSEDSLINNIYMDELQDQSTINPNPLTDQGVKIVLLDTPEQLLEHARNILKDSKNSEWKNVPIDKKLEAFQDKYKEFGRSFPIVLRHIVQHRKLYETIFKRYIALCKHKPTHSMKEFQERQADYLVMVYREEHPRCAPREIAMAKKKYIDDLRNEEEYMKKVMEEVQKERKLEAERFAKERRSDIIKLISRCIKDVPEGINIDLNTAVVEEKEQAGGINSDGTLEDDNLVLLPQSTKK